MHTYWSCRYSFLLDKMGDSHPTLGKIFSIYYSTTNPILFSILTVIIDLFLLLPILYRWYLIYITNWFDSTSIRLDSTIVILLYTIAILIVLGLFVVYTQLLSRYIPIVFVIYNSGYLLRLVPHLGCKGTTFLSHTQILRAFLTQKISHFSHNLHIINIKATTQKKQNSSVLLSTLPLVLITKPASK